MAKAPALEKLVVEVDAPAKDGEGKARRLWQNVDKLVDGAEHDSLWALFTGRMASNELATHALFGTRQLVDGVAKHFEWLTYEQVFDRVAKVAAGLVKLGCKKGDIVGIYSVNRLEWMLTDLACLRQGFICTPLYDTLGDAAVQFIIQQSEMKICVLSANRISNIMSKVGNIDPLKILISMDPVTEEMKNTATASNLELHSFEELQAMGVDNIPEPAPSSYKECVTLMYTSGTTGMPKGAMLSNGNLLSALAMQDNLRVGDMIKGVRKDDVLLSYLPLAHIFERMMVYLSLAAGASVGFYQGDANKLMEDIAELKPTVFASVPRLFNRIYDKIMLAGQGAGGLKAKIFAAACHTKRENLHNGDLTHWLYDRLVFGKIKGRLGGQVTSIITASAPLSSEVLDFLRYGFSCPVMEAYGATECSGAATATVIGDHYSGHVGVVTPGCEIKLVDIPEMNYTSKDEPHPRGEVCVRGPPVFLGYYKDEAKTKEAVDEDGWLHTGDVGMWDQFNCLKIIDRKKNIFKLAQGEYIAAEKIENVYQKCKFVAQAFVHGDSLKSYLVGIIVPDWETVEPWCKENGVEASSLADAVKSEKLRDLVLQDMNAVGKAQGLKSFELVKAIHLESTMFSIENDMLTPTFKLKRIQARAFYNGKLEELYTTQDKKESEIARTASSSSGPL